MRRAWLVVLLLAPASVARADTLQEIFQQAAAAQSRGELDAAIAGYERLIEAGVEDADVYYDLATAHARAGHDGQAIRWFEKALSVRPGDDGAQQGLNAVQTTVGRRRADRAGESTFRTRPPLREAAVRPFSEAFLAWLVVALSVLAFGSLTARSLVRSEGARLGLAIAAPLLGLLGLFAGWGLTIKTGAFRAGRPAVVVEAEAELRDGPDPRAQTTGRVLEGDRVEVLARDGAWSRVQAGAREGWVLAASVGEI